MPIMIMAYNSSCMSSYKLKINQHPGWLPYEYKNYEFFLTEEETAKNQYGKWRSKLIDDEKNFVNSKQRAESQAWQDYNVLNQQQNQVVPGEEG